jgi:hypothetical protein
MATTKANSRANKQEHCYQEALLVTKALRQNIRPVSPAGWGDLDTLGFKSTPAITSPTESKKEMTNAAQSKTLHYAKKAGRCDIS